MTGPGGRASGRSGEEDPALAFDPDLIEPASGLFNEGFFLATMQLRVTACRRMLRPLALALFEVVIGLPEGPARLADPAVVATMVRRTLRASDVVGRLGDGSYGLLMEDTPEDGAVWAVERLRRSLGTRPGGRVLRAGVACYPGHALEAAEVLKAAAAALAAARLWSQDRIEVASG